MTVFRRPGPTLFVVLGVFSIVTVVLGARALTAFDYTPGEVSPVPRRWLASSAVEPAADRPELLVFLHPLCSCSVATLHELSFVGRSATESHPAPELTILFAGMTREESQSSALWRQAREFPSAHTLWDEEARESKRFGVLTSGYALLYSASGALLFHGGITASRGHEGDNRGLDRLAGAIASGRAEPAAALVFGCALFGRQLKL